MLLWQLAYAGGRFRGVEDAVVLQEFAIIAFVLNYCLPISAVNY